jgi:DNA-binding CsgD family transcriptional regulator
MEVDTNTTTALYWALELACKHGGAGAALAAAGTGMPDLQRSAGWPAEAGELLGRSTDDPAVREALALGFLAGRVTHRPRARGGGDPTSFVMDRDLVVQAAEGESILRLPWFEDGLFVGRQLPDISEMPFSVRRLCIENYSAALAGEPGRFAFTSYGHAYSVQAVPVHGEDGGIEAVLAIATPVRSFSSGATAYNRTAERLESTATRAEQRAELHRLAGRSAAEAAERHTAEKARAAAERARTNAWCLRSRGTAARPADPPSVTPRETDVLQLASHGLTHAEIAEQLGVSAGTVKTHLTNAYLKLGASDKAAAVAAALRHGLIE